MKGFGIEIKNNLLEPKHREAMAESIWLYMWFLDKMTSVSEDGIGKVLGARPIKHQEINQDLSISEATYKRWISKLKKGGYINTKRTPYGLIISVNKAFKRFGRSIKNDTTGSVNNELSPINNELSSSVINDTSKEDNNTKDNNSKTITSVATTGVAVNNILEVFKNINPSYGQLYKNKTQRGAAERLMKQWGAEKLTAIIQFVAKSNKMQYAPMIHTPLQLEEKMGALMDFAQKEKLKIEGKKIVTL